MLLAWVVLTNFHSLKIKSWKGWNRTALVFVNVLGNQERPALEKQMATSAWYCSERSTVLLGRRNLVPVSAYQRSVFLSILRLCFCMQCTVCSRHTQISRCQNSSHVVLKSLRRLFRRFVFSQTSDLLLKWCVSQYFWGFDCFFDPAYQWEKCKRNIWLKLRPRFSQINPAFSSH